MFDLANGNAGGYTVNRAAHHRAGRP